MPIELAGISNENEFYSEHYLTTVFEGDIEETRASWRAMERDGLLSPRRRLEKAAKVWGRLRADYGAERSHEKRLLLGREFAHEFLDALGYERRSELIADAEGKLIPVLARRCIGDEDQVWVVEVPAPAGDDFETDPLQVKFRCEQFENIEGAQDIARRRKDAAETAVTRGVFGLAAPPRFVILLSMSQAVLIDRRKWGDSRLLRFRFTDIFGRSEGTTLDVTAALLLADSLAPGSGTPLIDRIDEESHRHAFGVSQDLKYALREAIEILGNEAAEMIVAKRRANREGVFSGENMLDAGRLTTECLRYMYRLLFLFFIEARPEFGFAPMKAKAYRTGYSLESLRELELVPLETDDDRNGHYISDTLDALFALVFEGTPAAGNEGEAFTFHAVRARLFDPDAVGTYLGGLRFRNEPMQAIIRLLSLSKGERGKGRGRISYAQLGISQLGAVYESLLSFSGFFATEDLIELKPAGKPAPGPLDAAFFAPLSRAREFEQTADPKDGEVVYTGNLPKVHSRGSFIYRLAGRNRENSASYYTPEPLARVLVKYALKDLLADKKADDILKLRIVEPAMGSAAFLVEVVNQLADRYLELKQIEVGTRIPHETFGYERQKVRAYLADRNVFGVDLNPIAVELGQVSLWLNCLHAGGFAPWFEDQVHAGNSLVGSRRAVFPVGSLTGRKEDERWHRQQPREIGWSGESREPDEVWHFLLPDPGMCAYDGKTVTPLVRKEDWDTLTQRRREYVQPLTPEEVETVLRLSVVVDALFEEVADRLQEMRGEVNDDISIWPASRREDERHVDFQEKMRRLARFHGDGVRNSVPWRRLRAAMDAWCALWFWPVDKADLLPSRAIFLQGLDLVLTQGADGRSVTTRSFATGPAQGRLFETVDVPAEPGAGSLFRAEERVVEIRKEDLFADVNVERLIEVLPWMPTAMQVAAQRRFMHFDLEFADVMRERGGFDLVIGNPPWLKSVWSDPNVLSEYAPEIYIRGLKSSKVDELKPSLLSKNTHLSDYLSYYYSVGGMQSFLSAKQNYPLIAGGNPNMYQAFMELSFRITAKNGNSAFIHQDAHLVEPRMKLFRSEWYSRIIHHFAFRNEIVSKMFAEVNHSETFSLNIYSGSKSAICFDHICDLFLPSTIQECYEHDGVGPVPGIRGAGDWDVRGHARRIVRVDTDTIKDMNNLLSDENGSSRFVYMHSQDTLGIIRSLANLGNIKDTLSGRSKTYSMWEEGATTRKGIFKISGEFKSDSNEIVMKGPCIYVANPFYKTPDQGCRAKEDFEEIDLTLAQENYKSRTNFTFCGDPNAIDSLRPNVPWSGSRKHHEHYRVAYRRMVQPARERTLAAALIQPGIQHVDTIESMSFELDGDLIDVSCLLMSLPYDYLVKSMQVDDLRRSTIEALPFVRAGNNAATRMLRLNCLSSGYRGLWNRNIASVCRMEWSKNDSILDRHPTFVPGEWSPEIGIRTDYARRQAVVELDVLVGMSLGISCDQLIEMYRTQFPVLAENESGTWYDQNGRIVWTCSKGLTGVGWRKPDGKKPSAREWADIYADKSKGQTLDCEVVVDFLPEGPTKVRRSYPAPFITCDREDDYRRAWAFFAAESQKKAA